MKRKVATAILFVSLFMGSLILTAGSDKAKDLFVSKCGQCHKKGKAPEFSTSKYASKQWKRFFTRNKHKRKKDISGVVTKDELKVIEKYLIDNAADSSKGESAGRRK